MKRNTPEQGEKILEEVVLEFGRKKTSLGTLPPTLISTDIGPTARREFRQVRAGIRPANTPSAFCLERIGRTTRLAYLDNAGLDMRTKPLTDEQIDQLRILGFLYHQPRQESFGPDILEYWQKALRFPQRMSVHVSDYDCFVFLRRAEPDIRFLPTIMKLTEFYEFAVQDADESNKRSLERFKATLFKDAQSEQELIQAQDDADFVIFGGVPYKFYIPRLKLVELVSKQMGFALYRSTDFNRFEIFTDIQLVRIKKDYESHLMSGGRWRY